uniref:Uncharacterized protein n=1 Tax=Rhizophora mucronata TaxID=61149 RepID=A0A2P2R2K8_RHIMU
MYLQLKITTNQRNRYHNSTSKSS